VPGKSARARVCVCVNERAREPSLALRVWARQHSIFKFNPMYRMIRLRYHLTLENIAYHTTNCTRCCSVTAMFVSHALAPPRGHAAEPHVNPPFTLHGHPSQSYSNKLLRDMYTIFLYTTVYPSNISTGSLCII
jgi:hypothetical protein